MDITFYVYARIALALCAASVMLGAFASHILSQFLPDSRVETFDTGIRYMFLHALAMLVLSLNKKKLNTAVFHKVMIFFLTGIVVFSGSLFLLATQTLWGGEGYAWIGAFTPVGGISFIVAWGILFFNGLKSDDKNAGHVMAKKGHRHSGSHRRSHRSEKSHTETAAPPTAGL